MELDASSAAAIISSVSSAALVVSTIIQQNRSLKTQLKNLSTDVRITGRDIKRLIVHDDKCTIEERINAGKEYVEMGGNGSTEVYVNTLIHKYRLSCEEREDVEH